MFGFSKRLSWQLLASVLVVMMLTIAAPDARAASTARTDPAVTDPGVQLASPAVVRILTTVSGQVIYHARDGSTITFPHDKSSPYYEGVASGSGALISPDGYVLTADHVVDVQPNDYYVQAYFLRQAIDEYAKTLGISIDEATRVFAQIQDQLSYSYQVTMRQVFLSTNYTGSLDSVNDVRSYEAIAPIVKSPPEEQDVAIIKVKTETDLPHLSLALASSIHVQDSVTAIAFPADADFSRVGALTNPAQSNTTVLNNLLTPSVNSGQISAEKTLGGTSIYEVSGNIAYSGSSGGPVVNSRGQIIGFVDAMTSNSRVVFLVPSETVALYTKQTSMTNQTGAFMGLWIKAINEFNASGACHWTQAYQDLKLLREEYPHFGAVQPFLEKAQANATPSECPRSITPRGNWMTNNWPLLAGLGAGAVLVSTGLLLFAFPRRKKAMPQPAATTTSTSASAMPVGTPMGSESAPAIRKCISGHVVTVETAHFCPECGAPIEEPRESKDLVEHT